MNSLEGACYDLWGEHALFCLEGEANVLVGDPDPLYDGSHCHGMCLPALDGFGDGLAELAPEAYRALARRVHLEAQHAVALALVADGGEVLLR